MRNDVRSLLQLRPKMSKPSVPAPPRPATPRQRGPRRDLNMPSRPTKKGKGKSKGASPLPKPKAEWCTTYKGREVCRRYQTGSCTNDQCPFAHVCAIVGCQQKHPPWIAINTRETARIPDPPALPHDGPHEPCSPLQGPGQSTVANPALGQSHMRPPGQAHQTHSCIQPQSSSFWTCLHPVTSDCFEPFDLDGDTAHDILDDRRRKGE